MDKYVISSCFDEEQTAYEILTLNKNRRITLKRLIENKNCPQFYILITKYLIKNNYSIMDIKRIIKRHIAVVSYLIIHEKEIKENRHSNDFFNNLLYSSNEIPLESLSKDYDDEWHYYDCFSQLFYYDDFEIIKKCISEIVSIYEEISGNDNIFTLLNNVLDYFYFGCKFADLKYFNHSDLLISYYMNNQQLNKFSFQLISEPDENSWVKTQPFSEKDIKEKILGHIINIIMINNNLKFGNEMSIMPIYYYGIMFNETRKKTIQDAYSFFDVDAKTQTASINIGKIKKSFQFKYNDDSYNFTKEGIFKI